MISIRHEEENSDTQIERECLPDFVLLQARLQNFLKRFLEAAQKGEDLDLFYFPILGIVHAATISVIRFLGESWFMHMHAYPARIVTQEHSSAKNCSSLNNFHSSSVELRQQTTVVNAYVILYQELRALIQQLCEMGIVPSDDDEQDRWFFEHMSGFSKDPTQWSLSRCFEYVQWIENMLNEKNWKGIPPFYIFISTPRLPKFSEKIYRKATWTTGFGGRLIVPNLNSLTAQNKDDMWTTLYSEGIYEVGFIDHSTREVVFRTIAEKIPVGCTHLDLCGGKGDFLLFLQKARPTISMIVDISTGAIEHAQKNGLTAIHADADKEFMLEKSVDVVTILFAIQWLSESGFENAFHALKSGGKLLCNIYPPTQESIQKYSTILTNIGFLNIRIEKIMCDEYTNYLLEAYKQ